MAVALAVARNKDYATASSAYSDVLVGHAEVEYSTAQLQLGPVNAQLLSSSYRSLLVQMQKHISYQ